MKLLASISILILSFTSTQAQIKENKISNHVNKYSEEYIQIADSIWSFAEVGYKEHASTALLQKTLNNHQFSVKAGVADMPTSFIASFGNGSPIIGILAEFDALPGFSQDSVPFKSPRENCTSGHACGHHLLGTAAIASGITISDWLKETKQEGTVIVFGTPAEEGGAGKAYMARAGLFDKVDIMLNWHPSSGNSASAGSSLAIKSAKFRFYGVSSHAAGSPERGRSALDGVEAMNNMVNMLREHIPASSRIHYVITKGGEAPNVVPDFAEVYYTVRHPEALELKNLFSRVVKCAEGAALGTDTKTDYEVVSGGYNLLVNKTVSEIMNESLHKVGGVIYDEKEMAFATEIIKSFEPRKVDITKASTIAEFKVTEAAGSYSTDVGDVSWLVPTAGLGTATWVPGTPAHSWQAVAAGGMSIGHKGMLNAAKIMALTAIELYQNPKTIAKAKKELEERRGEDFVYEPFIEDRMPPLNYRDKQ